MATTDLLNVCELFYSLQGESTFSGYPCVFIRLAGCNLRCSYCDAKYSYEEDSQSLTLDEIIQYVTSFPETIVEVTGGEPLLQKGSIVLLEKLLQLNRKVLLETNGAFSLQEIPDKVTIITDIKCPGSGYGDSFLPSNFAEIRRRGQENPGSVEVKFVMSDQNDYHWAKKIVQTHSLVEYSQVHFSPVIHSFAPNLLADLILKDQLPVKLQLQLHTVIWPDCNRGV